MLHGPLLGYAYMKDHDLFEYVQEGMDPYLLPRYTKKARSQDYDHMEHIEVALRALQAMCIKFGLAMEEVVDIRKQTAIAPLSTFRDSNIHLLSSTFARLNLGGALYPDGFEPMLSQADFIENRRFVHVRSEDRALKPESLFLADEAPPSHDIMHFNLQTSGMSVL